jgi:hypothetical protein
VMTFRVALWPVSPTKFKNPSREEVKINTGLTWEGLYVLRLYTVIKIVHQGVLGGFVRGLVGLVKQEAVLLDLLNYKLLFQLLHPYLDLFPCCCRALEPRMSLNFLHVWSVIVVVLK